MRLYEPEDGGRRAGAALRWGTAGLIVAGVHFGAGWWLVSHSFAAPPPDQAQGIPIDLEPVAEPQNAPAPNSAAAVGPAPAPQAAAAPDPAPPADVPQPTAAEPPDPTPPPPDVAPPAPEPPLQVTEATPPPPEPSQIQPPPEPPPPVSPPPPRDTKSDAVLAPAPPPRPKAPPKPDPRVLAREAAKRKALAEKRAQDRAERVAARAQARAARLQEGGGAAAAAAAPSSASSGADVASWRGAVVAHLNSFKPASNGASGTARVAFAVDRNGRVLGASLAGSSGDPQLDDAAVAMVRRASPVPAPPPELGGRINLTVPVRFH